MSLLVRAASHSSDRPVLRVAPGGQPARLLRLGHFDALFDLNQATLQQLDALPGIGPATAQAILDYRTQHGRFRSVDDLQGVRGIGDAKLEQIRPLVRV